MRKIKPDQKIRSDKDESVNANRAEYKKREREKREC